MGAADGVSAVATPTASMNTAAVTKSEVIFEGSAIPSSKSFVTVGSTPAWCRTQRLCATSLIVRGWEAVGPEHSRVEGAAPEEARQIPNTRVASANDHTIANPR